MGLFGVFAYLIEMYIRPQDWVSFMYGFPLVDVVACIALLIALFGLPQQKRPIILPQVYFVILYLLMVVLSNIFAGHTDAALEQLILHTKRAVLFFIFIFILGTTNQLTKVMKLMVILTVILAIQSMLQSKYGIMVYGQQFKESNRVAWIGAWDGPNVLCILFIIGIALSLGFISKQYNLLWRACNIICIGILVYGVYLTNSRGGFIGLLAVVSVFLWKRLMNGKRLSFKVLAFIISLALIIIALQFAPSRMSELSLKEESAHERTWLWESALNQVRASPIFGVGKGQFYVYPHTRAHNNFVQNMAEMGMPGLFIYVALMYLSLNGLHLINKNDLTIRKNPKLANLSDTLFIGMVGLNVATFFVTMELDMLFIYLGLCAAAVNIAKREIGNLSFRFSLKDMAIIFLSMSVVIFSIYLISVKEII